MSFSVCMLCNEDVKFVHKFVDFYLLSGAKEIFIYLDFGAPTPLYEHNEKIIIVKCEEIFIESGQPKRPQSFHFIQKIVYMHAFKQLSADWLLVCDVDEFVAGNRPLLEVLQEVPSDWQFIRIPVAEAIWGPGDSTGAAYECTYFRTRAPKGFGKLLSIFLYGSAFRYTKAGLTGHAMGKYFIKKDSPYDVLGIHVPGGVDWSSGPWAYEMASKPDIFVYHFEAIGYDRWRTKWGSRVKRGNIPVRSFNKAKRSYIAAFKRYQAAGKERELFESLYKINKFKAAILNILGLLRKKQLW
jgi:hypothetical protein